jgi:hypothetical protein
MASSVKLEDQELESVFREAAQDETKPKGWTKPSNMGTLSQSQWEFQQNLMRSISPYMADAESVLHTLVKPNKTIINHEVHNNVYRPKRREFRSKYHEKLQNDLKKTPLEEYQAAKWANTLKHLVINSSKVNMKEQSNEYTDPKQYKKYDQINKPFKTLVTNVVVEDQAQLLLDEHSSDDNLDLQSILQS